jgi:hypothetical protein
MASLSIGMRIALAMKPGESDEVVTSIGNFSVTIRNDSRRVSSELKLIDGVDVPFLQALPNATARSTTEGEVCNAGIISTSFLRMLSSCHGRYRCPSQRTVTRTSAAQG